MKRIAIVYDWFDKWGGVERLLLTLSEIFPQAVFFTSYFNEQKAFWAKNLKVKTSFIQKLPKLIKSSRILSLPFYPLAFEAFDFSGYDLVISVTSSFAKGIITRPETYHICYLLTPTRFLWVDPNVYGISSFKKIFFSPYLSYLKKWDKVASKRPDKIISISKTVAFRCRKLYQRESEVIYPPFDLDYWQKIGVKIKNKEPKINIKDNKYFLVVSRLEPYKKVDLIINVFNKLKDNLVIVGFGSQLNYLKKLSQKNVHFFSNLTDEQLATLYLNAKALIMAQEEDFGYVSLEAQFFSCPVIAYNKGGATETVIDKKNGIFFSEQKEESLLNALESFKAISYNLKARVKESNITQLQKFSKAIFIKKFKNLVFTVL